MRATASSRFKHSFVLLSGVAFGIGFAAGGLTVAMLELGPAGPGRGPRPPALSAEHAASRVPAPAPVEAHPASLPVAPPPRVEHAVAMLAETETVVTKAAMVLPSSTKPSVEPAHATVAGAVVGAPEAPSVRRHVEVRRGDTLLDILARAGIDAAEAHDAVSSLRKVANMRRLQIGQRLALEVEPAVGQGQRLTRLVFPVDAATEVHLVRDQEGGFAAASVDRPLQRELVRVAAEISDSVYVSARSAGLPPEALGQMVKLLSWDVDFQRDVHPGDRFETVFERQVNEHGEAAGVGGLLFVGLDTRGREIEAYGFTTGDGQTSFFDRDGRALRKWLLKTPIDGARLSSQFGPRRHPVLGYNRMHKGIDFAAPPGTPILAAGDGVIDFAGRNQGYGKYIRLKHNGEHSTAYAHLSRFEPGVKRGRRVRQGEVIGYVGSSGLATGPHLHYEVLYRGEQVNPLGLKAAFADRLQAADLKRFYAWRAEIDQVRRRSEREEMVAQQAE
jgi:murein DD-endopeptidase MepM/ murein hydrolase activator NlpD